MKKEIITKLHASFEALVHVEAAADVEFWFARELQEQLGYTKWENFIKVTGYALLTSLLIAACGKTPEAAVKPVPEAAPKPAVVSDARIEAEIAKAFEAKSTPVTANENRLADEAEAILSKYPRKNAVELLNVPEVNASLRVALTKLGQSKPLQNKINSTVELAAKMKGLEGAPGSVGLDLDLKDYDKARTSRMLQAVLSEDPKRIVGFLVEEIGEAAPELSLGGVQRASYGVAIKEQTPPPAAK